MAVLKEYRCAAHGEFEASKPKCPHGCSTRFVSQEFRTAPAMKSQGTKRVDRELQNLATDYRMSDIRNGPNGESVMETLRKKPQAAPMWGDVQHAAPGFSQRGDAATFSPGSIGVQGGNGLAGVKPMLHAPRPAFVNKPG
jgi:hypothetical protein